MEHNKIIVLLSISCLVLEDCANPAERKQEKTYTQILQDFNIGAVTKQINKLNPSLKPHCLG